MRDAQGLAFLGLITVALFTGELDATGYLGWGCRGRPDRRGGARVLLRRAGQRHDGRGRSDRRDGRVVPVAVGIAQGESPTVVQVAGIAVAILGVILASGPERSPDEVHKGHRGPLLMAGVAALGFGTALVLVAEGGEHSVVMTITTMRAVNAVVATLVITLFVRKAEHPTRKDLPTLVAIGAPDAGANGLYCIRQHVASSA